MADKAASASPADTQDTNATAAAAVSQDRNDTSSTSTGSEQAEKKEEKAEPVKGVDIVRDVLGLDANNQPIGKEKSPPSPSEKKDESDPAAKAATQDSTAKPTPDPAKADEGDVLDQAARSNFREDPVFKKVTTELRETRTARDAAVADLEKSKPLVKFAEDFRGVMEQTGLDPQSLGELVTIGALLKHDPQKARVKIREVLDELDETLGEKLPADLRKKVDDGDLDEADALEVSRARALQKRTAAATEARATQDQTTRQTQDAQKAKQAVANAVNARISVIRGSDTEFEKKEPQLEREIAFLLRRTKVSTIDEAVALVDKAMDNVNAFYKDMAPKPKPINTNGASSTATPAAAKTAAEAPADMSSLNVTRLALGLAPV